MSDELHPDDTWQASLERLHRVFGNYRAEWQKDRVFSLYRQPTYFQGLETEKPIILEGGRGTGKTTTLLAMSYEGRWAIEGQSRDRVKDWDYFACYMRMESNRMGNFRGSGRDEDFWRPIFAHYLNLTMCLSLLDMAAWYLYATGEEVEIAPIDATLVAESLGLAPQKNLEDTRVAVLTALVRFERSLQAELRGQGSDLSMQGAPVEYLAKALLKTTALKGRRLFFLFDEFENLQLYQQQVVNTLIKHSGAAYSIKVGMRPYGWKSRLTITEETLMEPADFTVIPVGRRSDEFDAFAESICNDRLAALRSEGLVVPIGVRDLLPGLSLQDEFERLGGKEEADRLRRELKGRGIDTGSLSDRELHTLFVFRDNDDFAEDVAALIGHPTKIADKMNNYAYAALFTIRRGKVGIRKYYCGWSVFLMLAEGNLRMLLWLVHECMKRQIETGKKLDLGVDAKTQTEAATDIAEKVLRELPDESQRSGQLTHLVLGLGRVFQVLASNPRGHLPEATQFMRKLDGRKEEIGGLLEEGVRHLALVEYSPTKMQIKSVKEHDYALHPIFSPFFCYSHRRKRKLQISDVELDALKENPGSATNVLKRLNASDDVEMPAQMSLYEELFR